MASNPSNDSGLNSEPSAPSVSENSNENEIKARVEEQWKKMNSGLPVKISKPVMSKLQFSSPLKQKTTSKSTPDWMVSLGLVQKKSQTNKEIVRKNEDGNGEDGTGDGNGEDAKRLAAAALAAVRDATASASSSRGKVEIKEVKDFAGEEIEVRKLVDSDSKEATENARSAGGPPSALDSVLEQIKKKPKLSVLDKTRKDWGEFKEENKGMEEELESYKKSSNQYLDRVSFLQRADYREFERERDARLALQAKRRVDSSESILE